MPQGQFTGARIRAQRLDRGIKQSDLAQMAGISSSYLNLIEHNRRRIAGKVLNDLARALGVEAASLSDGAEMTLIDGLRAAAAGERIAGAEIARTEEFAGRFPGWAALIAAQTRQIAGLEARVAALTDRLTHDPNLASSLHDVISAVTSIRATSSILVDGEAVDPDWQARFHRNIFNDSQRLADSSRALVTFLDGSVQDGPAVFSPTEEAEAFWVAHDFHLPQVELDGESGALALVKSAIAPDRQAARQILSGQINRYASDAVALPLADLIGVARAVDYDPAAIAAAFGQPIDRVLRRLATLPVGHGHPEFGLAICDGAGVVSFLRPTMGFNLPRAGAACPFWPIFHALGRPGLPILQDVVLPGDTVTAFRCYAVAGTKGVQEFDRAPLVEAVMLVRPAEPAPGRRPTEVGVSCRICPRSTCQARREPSILADFDVVPSL